ncbi:MAG TPA: AmmeMemoRadiSam system protein B [Candidatus Binatia bacterium]|nr:AmmeMemoRadiSam system protein B [Candidatus Binatia bacterium]
MKSRVSLAWVIVALVAAPAVIVPGCSRAAGAEKVRQPGVAGSFYPADPGALTAMIDDMLAHASPPKVSDPILAVVAPHAGYPYSGPVAAYTYGALKGHKYSRVVVIAPSHYEAFDYSSVFDGDAYATPLGTVPVDKAFARQSARMDSSIRLSSRGHAPTPQGTEHAIEVELPWLQKVLGSFQLVPIVMGDQSYESSRALGVALARLIAGGDTLIVASSDLSHYHPYDEAVQIDHKTLSALQDWDYFSMSRNFAMRVWEACGGAPIVAAMIAAERMGANHAELLRYANSGDTAGDHSRVVGYSSVLLLKTQKQRAAAQPFSLTAREKEELLTLARKSVEHAVRTGSTYDVPASSSRALSQERGAFVTLTKNGQLRGCVGYTSASRPLNLTVRDTATLAALRDNRFPPVTSAELGLLDYEISVLSPLRRVTDVRQIRVGQDGLIMKNGEYEGLLLPQVPTEQGWDRATFLQQTCAKAGMQLNCWKDENTDIFMFTALVFDGPRPAVPEPPAAPGFPLRPGQPAPNSPQR